jgi:hypothetical protein
MDHAEVRAALEEAFFRPGALRRLDEGEIGADDRATAVRRHLDGCAECSAELRELRTTAVALDVGFGPPPSAEQRMLDRVRQVGRQRGAASLAAARWRQWSPLRAAAVIALTLLAFGAGALIGLGWPAAEPAPGPRLANTAAVMGELLMMPDARQAQLVTTAGEPAGMVIHSPSKQWLAVLSSALSEPPSGRYECYLERAGESTFVGPMHFEDGTAFWAGPVTMADLGRPGDRFTIMRSTDQQPVVWGQF